MSNSKFIKPFGRKLLSNNSFNPKMDTTDQRVSINNPQELYEQYIAPENLMDELEAETIDDFDNDFYDYDDRTEYGLDVATASYLSAPEQYKYESRNKKVKR